MAAVRELISGGRTVDQLQNEKKLLIPEDQPTHITTGEILAMKADLVLL